MGQTTLRGQIWRALDAIDKQGESKHLAKQEQDWKLGQPVYGVFSGGTQNRVCGVHGFRGTAACEFVRAKEMLGYDEAEARRELAQWLGHNPHRTGVTYAYVPRR